MNPARRFTVVDLSPPIAWPAEVALLSRHFVLLVAADSRGVPDAVLGGFAARALEHGAVYVCCWGPDCERLHDLFDSVADERNPAMTDDTVIMTTWHADEGLDEATGFFRDLVHPAAAYQETCTDWVAMTFGHPSWAGQLRSHLGLTSPA